MDAKTILEPQYRLAPIKLKSWACEAWACEDRDGLHVYIQVPGEPGPARAIISWDQIDASRYRHGVVKRAKARNKKKRATP